MNDDRRSWLALVRQVGLAFTELVRAELAALAEDLGRSGSAVVRALVVAAIAGAFAFWTLGLTIYLAVELLAMVLPRAGAAAIVCALFLATSIGLLLSLRARWQAIEAPDATVRRRLAESATWWHSHVAVEDEAPPSGGEVGSGESGASGPEPGDRRAES